MTGLMSAGVRRLLERPDHHGLVAQLDAVRQSLQIHPQREQPLFARGWLRWSYDKSLHIRNTKRNIFIWVLITKSFEAK